MRLSKLAAGILILASTFACQVGEQSLAGPTSRGVQRVQRVGHSKPLALRQGPAGVSLALAAPVGGIAVQDMTQGVTPLQLAQALAGPGVAISNVTYTGANGAGALFSADSAVLGVKSGIILSTGSAAGVVGPNLLDDMTTDWGLTGDAQLTTLVGGNPTFDASVLEFDFVPDSSTIYIGAYVFGSEEYDVFVGSDFNDAMAFYVNGTNCALVGGQPVSINAINNGYPYGTPPASNPSLYRDNTSASGKTINTELNGVTRVLQCAAAVNKGVTNHIKLAIADTYDGLYDSDVFIGGGALTTIPSKPIPVPHAVATVAVVPDCVNGGGTVTLNGSGSYDAIGSAVLPQNIVSYQWYYGASAATGQLYGTGPVWSRHFDPTVGFPMVLSVTDSSGNSAETPFTVTVNAIVPPVDSFKVSPLLFPSANGQYVKMSIAAKSVGTCPHTLAVTASSSQADLGSAPGDLPGDIRVAHNDGSSTLSSNAQPTVAFNPATDTLYLRAETLDSVTNRVYKLVMSANGTAESTATVTVPHPLPSKVLAWAIFANGTITMNGNAGTDGYNSALGPYRANAHDSTGNVASIGPMKFNGNVLIQGDATSASTISLGRYVTGAVTQHSAALHAMGTLACPAGGYTPASAVGGSKYSYNAKTGALSASGQGSIVLNGSGPYHFSSISLSGQATLQVNGPGGQHVDVYVDDQLTSSGGGITNGKQSPTALAIIACGTPSKPSGWQLTGNASSYFTVYAPNHDMTLSGNGALYGCIVADDFTASGNAAVHADEALAGACGTSGAGGSGGNTDTTVGGGNGRGNGAGGDDGKNGNGHGDDGRGNGGDDGSGSHGGHGDR